MFDLGRPVPSSVVARVSQGWGRPRPGRLHRSLDISLPVGTPVLAVDRGVVIRADKMPDGDAGIWTAVQHPSGLVTRYLHLSKLEVVRGQSVARGQRLGLSGNTGHSTGPHLHLDLHVPAAMLPAVEAAVGRPKGGYGTVPDVGTFIPGEPWVPVDGYKDIVRSDAAAFGIPLYVKTGLLRPGGFGRLSPALVIGAAAAAAFFLASGK